MKKLFFLCAVVLLAVSGYAQTEQGVLPPKEGGQAEQYTEWKKVDMDGATYEYRIAFMKRKGLACNYDLQIKNISGKKLKVKVNTHYYDKFVKGNFGDKFEETIKPEKTMSFIILTQGCKGNKEKKDETDFERCMNCEFSYEIKATVD